MLVVTCVTGCIRKTPSNKKIMMDYMERKYGEEFTFLSIGTELYTADYVEMWVSSENLPGQDICVHMMRADGVCSDNYICYLMEAEVDEYIGELVYEIYGESRAFSGIPIKSRILMSEEISKNISISEYLKAFELKIHCLIFVSTGEETRDEDIEALRKKLEEHGCQLSMTVFYTKDKSSIDSLTDKSDVNNYWKKNNVIFYGYFIMKKDYQFDIDTKAWEEYK